ncbi:hypothetical protein GobsT_21940 [Gemmata obscuriglobus]|uniref:Lipoprotein n=1 Tax=Gemmata obscuriglobus TaxID=114 RepID=A0A2Z3H7B8_9BACT|nr:hypothetical protein [Gemmata obscuriglobus]AWM39476.1 hypothetical protein C1280_22440 [Gemmata obscuriglobus]QEG27438.1 hypothetical protein GobsT_21940 [Gemmata obscuriglobus]VTS04395.1 unnamed protein product [Gemmata obscuriglobus UQM 2246]
MRGFTLRAVPVCVVVFACGCFLTKPVTLTETANRTPTHAYWGQVSGILAQKPTGQDIPAYVSLVRTQTEALRGLNPEGVDDALVAAVQDLIRCEAEVLRRADMVDSDPAMLRGSKEMANAFATSNRAAAESKKRLRALQSGLNERHGGGFAPMGG